MNNRARRVEVFDWIESLVFGDDCIEWPFTRNEKGYGRFGNRPATRIVYERYVEPVPPGLLMRHVVCDNPPCVNVHHLLPGTDLDNTLDRMVKDRSNRPKGESNPRSLLTEDQVLMIRDSSKTAAELASELGVSRAAVYNVRTGRNWTHLPLLDHVPKRGTSRFSPEQVREIRASFESHSELARRYGVTKQSIWAIRQGLTYREVT